MIVNGAINRVTLHRRWGGVEKAKKEGEEQEEEEEEEKRKTEKRKERKYTNFIIGESTKYTNREYCRTITDGSYFKEQWCIGPDGSEKNLQGIKTRLRGRECYIGPAKGAR